MQRTRFFGWTVVGATFVLATCGWGVGFYGPPIFMHAVVQRTGWPVSWVSAAVTLHFLCGALVVANLPRLYRCFGIPIITVLGAALLAIGVLGWASARLPWQLFTAALFSGFGWAALGAAAVNAIIAPWFISARPAALGMAYNGASLGGLIFSPLWVWLIGAFGFVTAAWGVGLLLVAIVSSLATLVFSRTPEQLGQHVDGGGADTSTRRAASAAMSLPGNLLFMSRRFLTLATGMSLGLFAQIGLIAHLFSLLAPRLGEQWAGWAMGLATLCAIIGRTLVGWLLKPNTDRRLVAGMGYATQLGGSIVLMLAGDHLVLVWLGVVLFGSGIGNSTSLPPLIAQVEFTSEDARRAVPMIVAISQASYAFAPVMFGLLRESTGPPMNSSMLFFAVVALVQAVAMFCFMRGRKLKNR
ncbi:MFS transporter [Billgrantia endophytica]|uniref:MFS transporter n=1 Tax=Billgrantia endophytica TaxID=2033802 RepID=A0A2N7U4F3_9GAMM|nr:MFS transporter [Halomonas endophytica]PMR75312.1 MFS transporter [Halomonas endophytica]